MVKPMKKDMVVSSIILAGGIGERFGNDLPKQFIKLAGKPIISHTLDVFDKHPSIDNIVIVINKENKHRLNRILSDSNYTKKITIVVGGKNRQESSFNGLISCPAETTHVLIHDSVRPFVDKGTIDDCIKGLQNYKALDTYIDSADTIIQIDANNDICAIPERSSLKRGQTPQAFELRTILDAHEQSKSIGLIESTDDCNLVLKTGRAKIHAIKGSEYNIKITDPLDLDIAEKIFQLRSESKVIELDTLENGIRDQVMVVFGGSSGIGEAICRIGTELGAKMIPQSRGTGVDITNEEDVRKSLKDCYERYGRIDAVIISSGVLHFGPLSTMDEEDIFEQVNVNLVGSILVAKHAIPYLSMSRGAIVFFSSSSYTRGRANYATYSATKAGIVNLMQALTDEAEGRFRALAIIPQRTNTPMRRNNFGVEDPNTLLNPEVVASKTLQAIMSGCTGCTIDIRISDNKKL